MKSQWSLLLALLFALLVALFAVVNVEDVTIDYFFGTGQWPLILVILLSVLSGVVIMGAVGARKIYALKREKKSLQKEVDELRVQGHLAHAASGTAEESKL
ncbi:lipopolysaccharide assembly protein LapA domain-containing protein [Mesobacillus zeae]|uniref:DUF1049 domain-containing protein n=1 Tax=Mesobacillus zeae TaxID=1917180 RepID=A0A398B6J9_9BACI|nr:LapA family protein [Mesobacillus zeae]RID85729.1 DUF1049 domain-containing protein [Mesobacillus zeae]